MIQRRHRVHFTLETIAEGSAETLTATSRPIRVSRSPIDLAHATRTDRAKIS